MKVRRVDFSPDEWLSGTAELSDEDRGIYITICALIYSRGGPVRYDVLKGHSHSHGNKLQAALDRLELAGKITRNGSEIDQKRCENELEKARKRHEKALENGAKGGRPKDLGKPAGFRDEKLTINHQPSTDSDSSLRSESGVADATPAKTPSDRATAERLAAVWREELAGTGLPMPSRLTPKRIAAAAARWRGELGRDEERWRVFLGRIRGSPFLLGSGQHGWKANFGWALRADSIVETLEGKFDPRSATNGHDTESRPDPASDEDQWRARIELWGSRRVWRPNAWGPEPGAPGCCVPPRLLAEIDAKPRGETER